MLEWNLYGEERKDNFERLLTPDKLYDELISFQEVFGDGFGIRDLLLLMDIRAKVLIAEAINDAPEFLVDQIGKAYDDDSFHSKSRAGALGDIADTLYDTKRP